MKSKNILLALLSLCFYAFGQLDCLPLLLGSVLWNYAAGRLLMRNSTAAVRKTVFTAALTGDLLFLIWFKYSGALAEEWSVLSAFDITLPAVRLPLGISFFTFQGISYIVDVYRDPESGSSDLLPVLLFISFFPRLISGPLVRYKDVHDELRCREVSTELSIYGIRRFIFGLAKKVLISAAAADIADKIFEAFRDRSVCSQDFRLAWLGAGCYMLQIYYDFSGYSDMAIGISALFGFRTAENFNHPYAALSIRDFWRRWHISLSAWFRDYLYIPLGGSRKGKARTALNRMIVFLCTGLWHGASLTYLVWGFCHGLLSDLEDAGIIPVGKWQRSRPGRFLCRVYTLLSVMLLFVLFRAESLADGWYYIRSMAAFSVSDDARLQLVRLLTPSAVFFLMTGILLSGRFPEYAGNFLRKNFSNVFPFSSSFSKNPDCDRSVTSAARGTRVQVVRKHGSIPVTSAARGLRAVFLLILFVICVMAVSRGGFAPFIYFSF